jgi:hypothetical protein
MSDLKRYTTRINAGTFDAREVSVLARNSQEARLLFKQQYGVQNSVVTVRPVATRLWQSC